MTSEKLACTLSDFPTTHCSYDDIHNLEPGSSFPKFIPVGSVEFTTKYADHVGLKLPVNISYFPPTMDFVKRGIRKGRFRDALPHEFVKPYEKIKFFTGDIKNNVENEVDPDEEVWISEPVPFESEFRFYIQSFANKYEILGWDRYDCLTVINPDPDVGLVNSLAREIHHNLGPNAYSIDIGWRPDIREYDIVELNDAWALGFYNCQEPQSNPPTRKQYAQMLYTRWLQIVFCSL